MKKLHLIEDSDMTEGNLNGPAAEESFPLSSGGCGGLPRPACLPHTPHPGPEHICSGRVPNDTQSVTGKQTTAFSDEGGMRRAGGRPGRGGSLSAALGKGHPTGLCLPFPQGISMHEMHTFLLIHDITHQHFQGQVPALSSELVRVCNAIYS